MEERLIQVASFQKNVIKAMLLLEETYVEVATQRNEGGKPALILCDRGVMDASAYVDKETFERLLTAVGIDSVMQAKDDRYDLIIHLVSAARGAEDHYSLENNLARTESADEARRVDERLLQAWTGHPHIVCINNRTQFKEKVVRALQAICRRVGAPEVGDSTVKRKFLVRQIREEAMKEIPYQDALCEYTYLQDGEDRQQRLRKRQTEKTFVYTHVVRTKGLSGGYERYAESSRNIPQREYEALEAMSLPEHLSVQIIKRSFVHNSQYFSLAIFQNVHPGLMLLEFYEEAHVDVELPQHYLDIAEEVTSDPRFSMFNLSSKLSESPVAHQQSLNSKTSE